MHSLDSFYLPLHTLSTLFGEKFVKWLCGSTGGGKGKGRRKKRKNTVLWYLKFRCEDELTEETAHFCLGSPPLLY